MRTANTVLAPSRALMLRKKPGSEITTTSPRPMRSDTTAGSSVSSRSTRTSVVALQCIAESVSSAKSKRPASAAASDIACAAALRSPTESGSPTTSEPKALMSER
jgi:hypothetical protein